MPVLGSLFTAAVRLARTEISHAYQLATIRTAAANPFASGIKWHAANHANTCKLCRDIDGKVFPIDECPLDHPNGFCTFTIALEKSLEDIAKEIVEWSNGGENKRLDDFFEKGSTIDPNKPVGISLKEAALAAAKDKSIRTVNGVNAIKIKSASAGAAVTAGHAVDVTAPGGDNGGKGEIYRDQGLTNGGNGGIINNNGDIFKPVTPQAYEKISNLGVFGDERDDRLQNAMKYVLDNVKDKEPGTECLALYSYDNMSRIGNPNVGAFGVVEVIETDKDYVSIHNHASGETFSLSDVSKLREYQNCKGIFVIGNNGNMYGMMKTESYNNTNFYEYCMRRKLGFLDVNDEEFMKGCERYGIKYYRRAD